MKMLNFVYSLILAGSGDDVLNPIYSGISMVGPYAIGVVTALSIFYGVFLAVRYSKSKTEDERANAQKTLINFIIGAGVVIILIAVLYGIREPLADYING